MIDHPHNAIAIRIAGAAYSKELEMLRILDCPVQESYTRAFAVLDEVYLSAFAPERQLVLTRARKIGA